MCKICDAIALNPKVKDWVTNPYVLTKKKMNKYGICESESKVRKELDFTKAEIEQHNYNQTMKTGCWIESKRKEEKEKIKLVKETLKLIQMTDGNCALCAINNEWINEGIFFRNWNVSDVSKELQELDIPIVVTDDEVFNHKKRHLSVKNKKVTYDDEKHIENMQKMIKKRIDVNTLTLKDHLDSQVLTLSMDIRRMEECSLTDSKVYRDKMELLKSFLDMKLKAEGGDVQDVNVVNFWDKLEEKGIDL